MARNKVKSLIVERNGVDIDEQEEVNILIDYLQAAGLSLPQDVYIIEGATDPSVGAGQEGGIGSFYLRNIGECWIKVGVLDTDWVMLPRDASEVPFDDTSVTFVAADVQEALEAIDSKVGISASPGFSFGGSGNIVSGTWLLRPGQVPSNKAGVNVGLYNAELVQISTGTENEDTYSLEVYQHDGDEINLTLITTVNVTASRKEVINVTAGTTLARDKHIAIKISSGSAKNIGVDLQITGSSAP